jgi:hypothetical protein
VSPFWFGAFKKTKQEEASTINTRMKSDEKNKKDSLFTPPTVSQSNPHGKTERYCIFCFLGGNPLLKHYTFVYA